MCKTVLLHENSSNIFDFIYAAQQLQTNPCIVDVTAQIERTRASGHFIHRERINMKGEINLHARDRGFPEALTIKVERHDERKSLNHCRARARLLHFVSHLPRSCH